LVLAECLSERETQAADFPARCDLLQKQQTSSLFDKEHLMLKFATLTLLAGVLVIGATLSQESNPVVVIDTSFGKIKVELFAKEAPITVKNFLGYVDDKFYDGTIFHRVIPDFMIQGGGMEPGLKEKKTREPIKNEAGNGISNKKGTIAMARTNVPDSATAQFFINTKDNNFLDRAQARDNVGYAVFGRVIEGMDVVDKIRQVETGNQGGHQNVPAKDVVIRSIRRGMK
jgi:cyclophilin family peptidyl-prolyl cis-trans isomerase